MTTIAQPRNIWIKDPTFDLAYLSFGWIPIYLAFMIFENYFATILIIVAATSFIHRHYTFALVYGQKEEFDKRKKAYILLPIAFFIIALTFYMLGLFSVLLAVSVIWLMFHTIAQKYGLIRIYSRKAGYGLAWLDKGIIYSWFVYLFFALGERNMGLMSEYYEGRVLVQYLGDYFSIFTMISYLALLLAIAFTLIYIYVELKNWDKISLPKNIFVISVLLLYAIFFQNLIIGFIVFGFSHAIEYIAFVNVFVHSKYKKRPDSRIFFSRVTKKQWLYVGIFSALLAVVSVAGTNINAYVLGLYITGSSFLHFIYDGWIWKVSKPEVAKPLDINYASTRNQA
ncbi:MAG: hypothetical protein AAF462_11720 [Thermodesulfobacteriota bacterium]